MPSILDGEHLCSITLTRGFYVNNTRIYELGPVDRLGGLVVIVPARRAGDPGSNLGPGENFFS